MALDPEREAALDDFRQKLLEHREWEAKLKATRGDLKDLTKRYDQTEDNIKALQSVGQIIGEVLKQLDEERCMFILGLVRLITNASWLYSYCERYINYTVHLNLSKY